MNALPAGTRWRALLALLRPLPLLAFVAWALVPRRPAVLRDGGSRSAALVAELATLRLETTEHDVHWIDEPHGAMASRWERPRAVVRARRAGEAWDVFLVRARLSPEGTFFGIDDVSNLTRTSAASEDRVLVRDGRAAWLIGDAERTYRIEFADLRGEAPPSGADWNAVARAQRAVTNLARTGQLRGVLRRSFKLDPAAHRVALRLEPRALVVDADDHRISIPWDERMPIEGLRFIREDDREIARPGNLITWAVDRARDLSWFGDERMQLTKAIAYTALDKIDRALGAVHAPAVEEPDAEELGGSTNSTAHTDPDTGWPPGAIASSIKPPLPGEGQWFLLDRDPYVRTTPGVPVPLVTTFVRADGARPDSLVYVVAWDPRQVELDVVAGTEEPQSATGETGDGMIPRKPEIMRRVIAAFNGAFQSTHGDFGMMDDGSVIVPPKPYAATIARLTDGATGFGTWPNDVTIPKEMTSFRQNLTPLVADGAFNPYGRDWWGGVPHDWEDETHTVRSGLCLTHDGFVEYFYGTQIDHVHLARVMLSALCDYGVHLDMNQGHTGLELYRADQDANLPTLTDKLDGHWQAQGDVSDMPGWKFRGRRLVRNMQLMHFPRYIRRGARDYFYLMVKPLLPLAPFEPKDALARDPGEGVWVVKGLPQHGFPYALATTSIRPEAARPETKVRVLAIDPSLLRVASPDAGVDDLVLSVSAPERTASTAGLWVGTERGWIADDAPSPGAVRIGSGVRIATSRTTAAAGIDGNGKVVYAEVATAPDPLRDGALLASVLETAGCIDRLFFSSPLMLALGGTRDASDHPVRVGRDAIRFTRAPAAGARRLFPETPILRPEVWMPLQRQTRWFPKEPEPGVSAAPVPSVEP